MKRVLVSVTNDLATDRRVDRTCRTLVKAGFNVCLIGRKLVNSLNINNRPYKTKRISLLFNKGFLFYAEYNLRLFFILLFKKADLLYANDLDTLLPNYLVKRIKSVRLIYDTHEYFAGVPELENRNFVRKVWLAIERFIFPKLTKIITVNDSIASLYEQEYSKKLIVIRNVPFRRRQEVLNLTGFKNLLGFKKIIIMQGAGFNIHRGAEEAVEAMQYVDNAVLLIIGGGDVFDRLYELRDRLALTDKVIIKPKMPFEELQQFTINADLGLSLDKDNNINYKYSLPNKIFDYIQAEIPVLVSPLPELKKIVDKYDIGDCIDNHKPLHIAQKINQMLADKEKLVIWEKNLKIAAQELCWENEEKILFEMLNAEL